MICIVKHDDGRYLYNDYSVDDAIDAQLYANEYFAADAAGNAGWDKKNYNIISISSARDLIANQDG